MDIEPPEVPLLFSKEEQKEEGKPAKQGFFAKLFSKKKNDEISDHAEPLVKPRENIVLDLPPLPDLPPLADPLELKSSGTDAKQEKKPSTKVSKGVKTPKAAPSKGPVIKTQDIKKVEEDAMPSIPDFDIPLQKIGDELPPLPELPMPDEQPNIFVAGDKKKKGDKKAPRTDLTSAKGVTQSFNWTAPIAEQEQLIKNSNRNNPEVNELLDSADRHVDNTKNLLASKEVSQSEYPVLDISEKMPEIPSIPEVQTMPAVEMNAVHPEVHKSFKKMDSEHKTLRKKLHNRLNKDLKKTDIRALLKQYDMKVEQRIEQKELELSSKRKRLEEFSKILDKKEAELQELQKCLSEMDVTLKEKESIIEDTVSKETKKRVALIGRKERNMLKQEILNTVELNKRLKKQVDTIEKDRIAFDNKKNKLLSEERNTLTKSQVIYEKKLAELEKEKSDFELRKRDSMQLLERAGAISKELEELRSLRNSVSEDKKIIDEMIIEDKGMREAVRIAEDNLKKEREDLDRTVFTKYIQWKLGEAKLGDISREPLLKPDMIDRTSKIYSIVEGCKSMLAKRDIKRAKELYMQAKSIYENSSYNPMEKVLIYNKLRALYSDIQLTSLDADITV